MSWGIVNNYKSLIFGVNVLCLLPFNPLVVIVARLGEYLQFKV